MSNCLDVTYHKNNRSKHQRNNASRAVWGWSGEAPDCIEWHSPRKAKLKYDETQGGGGGLWVSEALKTV